MLRISIFHASFVISSIVLWNMLGRGVTQERYEAPFQKQKNIRSGFELTGCLPLKMVDALYHRYCSPMI